jgi:hypothetical protein
MNLVTYLAVHQPPAVIDRAPLNRLFRIIKNVRQMAASTVLTIVHCSHKDTCSARLVGTLPPQALDLAVSINLVVLEYGELSLLALVLNLLGSGVDLLLALLAATTQT